MSTTLGSRKVPHSNGKDPRPVHRPSSKDTTAFSPATPVRTLRLLAATTVGPTRCTEMKLVFIIRGETEITHGQGSLKLTQGEAAFLPANQEYLGTPPVFVETITIYIEPEFASEQIRWLPHSAAFLESLFLPTEPQPLTYPPQNRPRLHHHLQELTHLDAASPGGELQQLAHVTTVLGLVQPQHSRNNRVRSPYREEVVQAIALLEKRLECCWTVQSLAHAVALSPSHLTRLFTDYTGIPPSQYLRNMRAHRMRKLLLAGNLNVTEAAQAVGWSDLSHASRAYRAVFGCSPSTVLAKYF